MGRFVSTAYGANTSGDHTLTKAEERKLRKVQNRLNQRARRDRIQGQKNQEDAGHYGFKVHRWRLGWPEKRSHMTHRESPRAMKHLASDDRSPKSPRLGLHQDQYEISSTDATIAMAAKQVSPMADQLLHLIQYNAFRGLYRNKHIIGSKAVAWSPDRDPEPFDMRFPAFSVVLPVAPGLPRTLDPTESQMRQAHSAWISTLPFPAMREAFIRNEDSFDHAEFANDVIGDLIPPHLFSSLSDLTLRRPVPRSNLVLSGIEDDDITANRNGLIIWGEPYLVESWEATPGFLQKWVWALEGCEELLESSNRWRRIRGEEPLRLSHVEEVESH